MICTSIVLLNGTADACMLCRRGMMNDRILLDCSRRDCKDCAIGIPEIKALNDCMIKVFEFTIVIPLSVINLKHSKQSWKFD